MPEIAAPTDGAIALPTKQAAPPETAVRIRETRLETGFGGNPTEWVQVRDLAPDEPMPEGAAPAEPKAQPHPWRHA